MSAFVAAAGPVIRSHANVRSVAAGFDDVLPLDPPVLPTGPVGVGMVTVTATVIPAGRAAHVDPEEVLGAE